MRKILNNKQEEYLKSIVKGRSTKEIQDLIYKKYNIQLKRGTLETFKRKNKLKSGMRIEYTNEQKMYLKKIVKYYSTKEVIKMFYKKYNIKLTKSRINHFREKYKLYRVENTGQYKKGNIPFNKQKIGYEFKDKEGYTWKKIDDCKFERKQKLLYEEKYGKIPKGYSVIFLDKNKDNFNINNLKLIKNKDKLTAKNMGLITTNKELTEIGILTAQLINKKHEKIDSIKTQ